MSDYVHDHLTADEKWEWCHLNEQHRRFEAIVERLPDAPSAKRQRDRYGRDIAVMCLRATERAYRAGEATETQVRVMRAVVADYAARFPNMT